MRPLLLLALLAPLHAHAACKSKAPESFDVFFARFAEDKDFALSRTRYPLDSMRHEVDDSGGKYLPSIVSTPVTRDADARNPTLRAYARENGMQMERSGRHPDDAAVRMYKPGTDWLYSYHFERTGACWTLFRVVDHSL